MSALGERFLVDARRILRQVKETRANLRAAVAGRKDRLSIGVSPAIADSTLSRTLTQLRRVEAGVDVSLRELSIEGQGLALEQGDIEFALAPICPRDPGLSSEVAWRIRLSLLVPVGHRLSATAALSPQDLAEERLVAAHPDLIAACETLDRSLRIAESEHLSLLIEEVAAGLAVGVACASELVSVNRPDIAIVPAERYALNLTAYAIWNRASPETAVRRFLQHVPISLDLKV